MNCRKVINLLYNTAKQTSKFRTKIWIEIDDDARGIQTRSNQIENYKDKVNFI